MFKNVNNFKQGPPDIYFSTEMFPLISIYTMDLQTWPIFHILTAIYWRYSVLFVGTIHTSQTCFDGLKNLILRPDERPEAEWVNDGIPEGVWGSNPRRDEVSKWMQWSPSQALRNGNGGVIRSKCNKKSWKR